MPPSPTPTTPPSGPRWPALRRFLDEVTPSLTLARALERQDTAFLKRWSYHLSLHAYGADAERRLRRYDRQGFTPVQQFARHGHDDGVHHLLHLHHDLALQRSQDGQRLVDLASGSTRWAVQRGLQEGFRLAVKHLTVVWLTRLGQDPAIAEQKISDGMQGLDAWLQAGADVNLDTFDPRTGEPPPYANALSVFAGYGMVEACRLLLEHGADPQKRWLERDPGGDRISGEDLERWRRPSLVDTLKQRNTPDAPALLDLFARHEAVQLERTVRETLLEIAQASVAPDSASLVPATAAAGTPETSIAPPSRGRPRL